MFCCCLLSSFIGFWLTVVGAILLYILFGSPSKWLLDLNPLYFRLPLPNVNDSVYRRNRRLIGNGEKMHSTSVSCPKSLALDVKSNKLYTGTLDGKVVSCSLVQNTDAQEVLKSFEGGRPLGMRLKGNLLYFLEANSGLYLYNLETKVCKHLLDLSETKFLDGRPSVFFDDLAVDKDVAGSTVIYITDVSRKFNVNMWVYTYLEPDTSGRILRYDVATGICTVVLENLCFPNGIEVTEGGRSLLICELAKRRVLQHHLKGPSAGLTTVFIDNLPGEPENVRRSLNGERETYWIGLALTRDYRSSLAFLENFCTSPTLRKIILRSCFIFGSFLQKLGEFFSNESWKSKGQNWKSGIALVLDDFMSNPGMAIEVDGKDGNVLLSLQVKDDVSVISEIAEVAGPNGTRILYTGSSGGPMSKIILE